MPPLLLESKSRRKLIKKKHEYASTTQVIVIGQGLTTTYFDITPRDADENMNYNMDFSMHLSNFKIKIKKKYFKEDH